MQETGVHRSFFRKEYKTYPKIFQEAGYPVGYTSKGWSLGDYKCYGRKNNPAGPTWNNKKQKVPAKGISRINYTANFFDFIKSKKEGQPFCFWYGSNEPRKVYEFGVGEKNGKKIEDAVVPQFIPDNEVVRKDILDYAYEIEWFDKHLVNMLNHLKKIGELKNTLIIVTSDNGMPFPRAKANLYELGTDVPLAICWGKNFKGGTLTRVPVSTAQLSSTIYEAVGIDKPDTVTQPSFMPLLKGEDSPQVVFTGCERHTHARYDNMNYPCRAIRTDKFLLIRNIKSESWPAGDPKGDKYYDIDASPSKTEILKENGAFLDLSTAIRPEFELFDIKKDPYNINNLASNPDYQTIFHDLSKKLHEQLKKDGDPRFNGYGDIFENYPRVSNMRSFMGGFNE